MTRARAATRFSAEVRPADRVCVGTLDEPVFRQLMLFSAPSSRCEGRAEGTGRGMVEPESIRRSEVTSQRRLGAWLTQSPSNT